MATSYFVSELNAAKKNRKMVAVYFSGEEPDSCATGYVLDVTEEGVTLEHFTKDGAPDGKTLIRMDHVFMVDVDGRYERMVAFLAENYDQIYT